MNEYADYRSQDNEEEEYINIGMLIRDYLRFLKRTWFLLILLLLLSGGGFYLLRESKYVAPSYTATVYYSMVSVSDLNTNVALSARLANSISAITGTKDFRNDLSKEMGQERINASYSFKASTTASANLFSVTINCTDPALVNQLLKAFEAILPEWANKSIGNCTLTIMDEAESIGINNNELSIKKALVYAVALAGFIWFILATLRIITVRKIHNQSEMYQVIDAECLGTVPKVRKKKRGKSKRDPLLITNTNIDVGYLQSIRTIRYQMEYWLEQQKKVLLLTSTLPKEGKSILTLNMAYALAHGKKKVLVIDTDFYQSGINDILQIPSGTTGLSEYLKNPEKKQITLFQRDNLSIIPIGNVSGDMTSLSHVRIMKELIDKVRDSYDVILIDSPAVNSNGDAVMLSEAADQVIYVIQSDRAEVRDIRKGIKPFFQSQKLGGYILNGVTEAEHGYGGQYGYGYSRYRYGSSGYHNYSYYGEKDKKKTKEKQAEEGKDQTTRLNL